MVTLLAGGNSILLTENSLNSLRYVDRSIIPSLQLVIMPFFVKIRNFPKSVAWEERETARHRSIVLVVDAF